MSEKKEDRTPTQPTEPTQPVPAKAAESAPPKTYAHGLSEEAHQVFLAFERRYGGKLGEKK